MLGSDIVHLASYPKQKSERRSVAIHFSSDGPYSLHEISLFSLSFMVNKSVFTAREAREEADEGGVQRDIIFLRSSRGEHGGARAHQRDAQRKVSIVFSQCFIHNPYLVLVSPRFL